MCLCYREIKKSGYEIHHAFREKKRGGGAAIIYKMQLAVKEGECSSSEYSSFEYSYVILTLESKRKLVLVCLYRKQEVSFTLYRDEMESFMDKVSFKGDAMLVVGDFNVWMIV